MLDKNKLGFISTDMETEVAIHDFGSDVDQLLISDISVLRQPENLDYLKEKHDLLNAFLIKLGERKAA